MEKLRLKVEGELDRLRGEFRKKEVELLAPLINKYTTIEMKIEGFIDFFSSRLQEHERSMLLQEHTIGIILNSLA